MAQPGQPRNYYPTRLPERTAQSSSQPPLSQTAPAYGRPAQVTRQPQQTYGGRSHYGGGVGVNRTRGPPPAQTSQESRAGPAAPARIEPEPEENPLDRIGDEQRDEINEAFSLFDLNQDNHLDLHEFRVALRALGFTLEKTAIADMMTTHGIIKPYLPEEQIRYLQSLEKPSPSNLLISHANFEYEAARLICLRTPGEEIERAFYLFDADHKGYISLEDLRRVTRELGETSLEDQELITMIEEFDYDNVGGISKDAFHSICLQ